MRFGQSFVVALLASAFGLVPMNVVAQGNGFLVLSKPTPEKPSIRVVECPEIALNDKEVRCNIIDRSKYNPIPCNREQRCYFHGRSAFDVPGRLIYGVSYVNPTCAWMYDSSRQEYYAVCWD